MEITDEMIEALRTAETAGHQIQGFFYKPDHVIRDLRLQPGRQEVWRGTDGEAYCEALRRFKDAEIIAAVAPLILEEAAKVADAQSKEDEIDYMDNADPASGHGAYRADEIAKAIRALKEPHHDRA